MLPSKVEKATTSAATMLEMLGKLIQGTQSPQATQQTQARSGTVPNVAGGPPTSTGAARQFPNFVQSPMPLPSQPQPPGTMQTGLEFRTPEAARGAVATGMLANIAGAISDWKTEKVKKEHFQVENTISMLQALFQSGDPDSIAAAKSMLSDEKTIRSLDKYLTGGYPRLPVEQKKVQQPESPGPTTGMEMVGQVGMPEPGKPGGPWMPTASPMASMKAQAEQKLQDALTGRVQLTPEDRQLIGLILGPQAALTGKEYIQSVRVSSGIQTDANTVATLQNTYDINLHQMGQQHDMFLTEMGERALALDKEIKSRESIAKISDATQNAAIRAQYDASVGILRGGKQWEDTMQGALAVYNQTKNAQNFALQALEANKRLQASIMTSKASLNKYDTPEAKTQMKDLDDKMAYYEAQNKQFMAIINQSGARKWEKLLSSHEEEKPKK